jgi:porin
MRFAFLLALAPLAFLHAAEPSLTATPEQPTSPALLDRMGSLLAPEGSPVQLQLSLQQEVLSNVSGGFRRGTIYEGLVEPGLQVDLGKAFGWNGATFQVNGFYGFGPSLTGRFTHDLNVLSNIDAYDSARLNELWLQQELFDGHLSIRLGLLTADTEFMIVESGTLFLNSCFGAPPLFGTNVPASPTFPLSAPGLRIAWDSKEAWLVRAAVYSDDSGDQAGDNKHGLRFTFSSRGGALALGEIVHKHSFAGPSGELPGTVKVGGFYTNGIFADLRRAEGTDSHGLGCVYASFDQALYRVPAPGGSDKGGGKATAPAKESKEAAENDHGLNGYIRFGYAAPERRAVIGYYSEAGLTYKGLFAGRDDDTCGLALSDSQLSAAAHFLEGEPVTAHHEVVLEATYQAVLNKHLNIQPDVQVIFNPGGTTHASTALVLGVRWAITF